MFSLTRGEKFNYLRTKRYITYMFLFLFFSIVYMEWMTRIAVNNHVIHVWSPGLIMSSFFGLAITLFFLTIIFLFPNKSQGFVTTLILISLYVIYSSQIIYHNIFRTFYNFQSLENASQGLSFTDTVISGLKNNWLALFLLLIPILVFILLKIYKVLSSNNIFLKGNLITAVVTFISFIVIHILSISILKLDKLEQAHDLYYFSSIPNLSVENLGLITTMRLDFQRYVTGWSPKLKAPETIVEGIQNEIDEVDEDKEIDEVNDNDSQLDNEQDNLMKYKDQILSIDLNSLINEEQNDSIKQMHQYFYSLKPSKQNEFTGKFEGYNLILITAEAFAPYAIDKELTPTLYKLANEGYKFTNFYTPLWGVSTSDGEYVSLTGLLPKPGIWSFSTSSNNAMPFTLGNQLKDLGYVTKAYHNHKFDYYDRDKSHPNIGYEYKGIGNGLEISNAWPRSDIEMIDVTTDEYIDQQPFHAYYMTVSGHLEYNFVGNMMAMKNRHLVDHLNLSEQAKAYLATQIELDRALELLLERLEEKGVLDNTLIVISADHYPYGLENKTISELTGKYVDEEFGIYKNTLIMYAENMDKVVIDEPMSNLDILPTLLNLMGIPYDSRLLMGRDVFSDEEPLVIFSDKSFITEKGKYYAPTNTFTPFKGIEVDSQYIQNMKNNVDAKLYYSSRILDYNYYEIIKNHLGKSNE